MDTRDGVKRVAGPAVAAMVVLLALSLCCTVTPAAPLSAGQHGCCETECASAAPAAQTALVAAAKNSFERSPIVVAVLPRTSPSRIHSAALFVDASRTNRIEPLTTIQLRI